MMFLGISRLGGTPWLGFTVTMIGDSQRIGIESCEVGSLMTTGCTGHVQFLDLDEFQFHVLKRDSLAICTLVLQGGMQDGVVSCVVHSKAR